MPLSRIKSTSVTVKLFLICILISIVYWTVIRPPLGGSILQSKSEAPRDLDVPYVHRAQDPAKQRCPERRIADKILVMLKTGATQSQASVPIQLLTALRCVPNLLVVSDLEQDIAGVHLHDVLTNVNETIRQTHIDFDLYRKLQLLKEQNLLDHLDSLAYSGKSAWPPGWHLDKYKFLHMLEFAWKKQPNMDWYVLVETDTYLIWPSLLAWLDTLDPSQEALIGSPNWIGTELFPHGGSGIVFSGAAMRKFGETSLGMATLWDERMSVDCCGDHMLGLAAEAIGVPVLGAWPMLGEDGPRDIRYGPAAWCEPIVTMHHMSSGSIDAMQTFADSRQTEAPITFQDVFQHFLTADSLPPSRNDWSNEFTGDVYDIKDLRVDLARVSFEACREACSSFSECFQFQYKDAKECRLFKGFTLGKKKAPDDNVHWRSGWNVPRIKDWVQDHAECPPPTWVNASVNSFRHDGNGATHEWYKAKYLSDKPGVS